MNIGGAHITATPYCIHLYCLKTVLSLYLLIMYNIFCSINIIDGEKLAICFNKYSCYNRTHVETFTGDIPPCCTRMDSIAFSINGIENCELCSMTCKLIRGLARDGGGGEQGGPYFSPKLTKKLKLHINEIPKKELTEFVNITLIL